jgi:hypothetical protein
MPLRWKRAHGEAMAFSISQWLLRRRIDAQVRISGRPMEHRRVANPYHAVSVETGPRSCPEARAFEGRRFLADSAPMLPLRNCSSPTCQCRYQHYNDRRGRRDRRVLPHNPYAHKMGERRSGTGRRISD